MRDKKTLVKLNSEKTFYFGEHEILLSFNEDSVTEKFYYWWEETGIDLFLEYLNKEANEK